MATCSRFHKHFTPVIYSGNNISSWIWKTLHQCMDIMLFILLQLLVTITKKSLWNWDQLVSAKKKDKTLQKWFRFLKIKFSICLTLFKVSTLVRLAVRSVVFYILKLFTSFTFLIRHLVRSFVNTNPRVGIHSLSFETIPLKL
jgi:hypothetical protein